MNQRTITCPYCASQVSGDSTICPGCQEDLAALAHLEYADMIHYNQALAFAREGHLKDAREELAKSITANKSFGPAYTLLAKVYAHEDDWEHAKASIKKALNLMPSDDAVIKLADEIVSSAPLTGIQETTTEIAQTELEEALSELPEETTTETEPGQLIEETSPAEPLAEPEKHTEQKPRTVSPKSRLITEHADAEDVASLSAPLPWLEKPKKPSARLVHVSRTLPQPVTEPTPRAEPAPEEAPIPKQAEQPPYTAPEQEQQPEQLQTTASFARSLLPEDSIWRTVGMGILLTVGLAIIIRTLTGED